MLEQHLADLLATLAAAVALAGTREGTPGGGTEASLVEPVLPVTSDPRKKVDVRGTPAGAQPAIETRQNRTDGSSDAGAR